ncbi:MAG: hypothetical protein MJE66_20600, partial [Proteobacteria bacterium]|nr:hypothetical protein [Pseudomonadota bacterium]
RRAARAGTARRCGPRAAALEMSLDSLHPFVAIYAPALVGVALPFAAVLVVGRTRPERPSGRRLAIASALWLALCAAVFFVQFNLLFLSVYVGQHAHPPQPRSWPAPVAFALAATHAGLGWWLARWATAARVPLEVHGKLKNEQGTSSGRSP